MRVWLLQPSEILPLKNDVRLMRMGLLGDELSKNDKNEVIWFTSSFDHFRKKQLFDEDTIYKVNDNYALNIIYAKGYKKNISISRIVNHKIIGDKLKKKMRQMDKPDIIFVSFPTIEFALEAVKYGKKNNIPVIVDIRDLWPDIFKHNLEGILKLLVIPYVWFLNIKTKKILREATNITGVSDLVIDWGLKKGNRNKNKLDKAFYIGYKNDDSKVVTIDKYKHLFDGNAFNICFFATINNQFNYDLIIEIAKSLEKENVNIIICGNGPQYDLLSSKCNDIKNIALLGWCSKDELRYILANSFIGLAPYKDTFDFRMSVSNKFCEYLSNGLPVIVTCLGYMKEIIDKNNIGISSMDVDEIKKFVIDLKDNPKKRKKMSDNAKVLFNKYFDANKIYPNMVKYIENVWKEYNK